MSTLIEGADALEAMSKRVNKLEKHNQILTVILIAAGTVFACLGIIQHYQTSSVHTLLTTQLIRTESIQVIDKAGRSRGLIGSTGDAHTTLILTDADGNVLFRAP